VSRYDGVKYGHRAENFSGLDELYTNSRTEAFGDLLKTAIIFGSETLSTENYMKVYDKCLRTRRVIVEEFAKLFGEYDAVVIPACSTLEYKEETLSNKHIAFEENFYTAPASITGLPAVVCGGIQLIGKAFSEKALLNIAKTLEKGGN
jgi:aspartyl-tRNA(Asn)/glutamyl-tRNA(Gln) amidotransferase subunit A